MRNCLIVGGAGYVGSHFNKALSAAGVHTVVYDSLVYGHREAVKWGDFVLGDLDDLAQLRLVFKHYGPEAVAHFSAFAYVGESVADPEKYYGNNVSATLNLLKVMREFGCHRLIFSSSCATYGQPLAVPIAEDHPQNPISPYGRSKLMVENILADYAAAYNFKYAALRYFNAAGADPDGEIGENHDPETHLIPLVLEAAAQGGTVKIFGTDYDTPDGTCVRDYIHVSDLAEAHILALKYLESGGASTHFNLGNGQGYSVREVIDCARRITGREIKTMECPRRPGDPPILVGACERAKTVLGWKPRFGDLDGIVGSAWMWQQKMVSYSYCS